MKDEFDRIMEYLALSPEEKEDRLKDVFEDAVEYFDRFKYIMIHGTPEEKERAMERIAILKKSIDEETQRVCEKTGMTEEQISQFSNDPKNFKADQWDAIQTAKTHLEEKAKEVKQEQEAIGGGSRKGSKPEGEKGAKKRRRKPKDWIPS